jgi:hypothetical protein
MALVGFFGIRFPFKTQVRNSDMKVVLKFAYGAARCTVHTLVLLATRIDFNLNCCLKQSEKVLAFSTVIFENSKSRGSIH